LEPISITAVTFAIGDLSIGGNSQFRYFGEGQKLGKGRQGTPLLPLVKELSL
jgi:hypothetical protein